MPFMVPRFALPKRANLRAKGRRNVGGRWRRSECHARRQARQVVPTRPQRDDDANHGDGVLARRHAGRFPR